jgi:hypothetical protein
MAAIVTQHVVEVIIPRTTYSPATPTGVGVTQHVLEAVIADDATRAAVTLHVVEVIVAADPDGSHGGTGGGGGTPTPVTHSFGYAV